MTSVRVRVSVVTLVENEGECSDIRKNEGECNDIGEWG